MELQQFYNDYYIQIIVGLVLTFSLFGFLLYLTVKSYLLNKALEYAKKLNKPVKYLLKDTHTGITTIKVIQPI